jgi:hypothetical protein
MTNGPRKKQDSLMREFIDDSENIGGAFSVRVWINQEQKAGLFREYLEC